MKNETEHEIQSAFFKWLSLHEKRYPELGLFYAIPNGSYKSIAARMKFQREGLKSGVPDVHLPIAKANFNAFHPGLWIEFKSKTGKVSVEQSRWILQLKCSGHRVEVCESWMDAANITIEYLGLPITKLI